VRKSFWVTPLMRVLSRGGQWGNGGYHCMNPNVAVGLAALGCAEENVLGSAWMLPCQPAGTMRALCTNLGTSHRCRSSSAVDRETSGLVVPLMREISEMLYRWDELFVVGISALDNDSG